MMTRTDRIAGAIFGAACGDALGAAYECLGSAEIHGILREPFAWEMRAAARASLLYPRVAGRPTDDSAMALSVAATLTSGEALTAATFARRFRIDLERGQGRFAAMFWNGGPGGATTHALARLRGGCDPDTCGLAHDDGNGAAMRVYPVGFLADRNDVLQVAAGQARVTHGHPGAIAAAQTVALTVFDALAGAEASLEPPDGIVEPTLRRAWHVMHAGLAGRRLPAHLLDVPTSGWATVAAAHAIAYMFRAEPDRAIAAAAASGRDTDTMASLVGAIVGARHGVHALPRRWIDALHERALFDLTAQACAARFDREPVICRSRRPRL